MAAARRLLKDERSVTEQILDAVKLGKLVLLMDEAEPLLREMAEEGGAAALAQVGIVDDESIVSLVNEHAVEYAKERAAELVGKKIVDGEVVDNPNAEWAIDDSTRELLRADVETAVAEGWSNDELADALAENYAFSDERAETIARTETAFADVSGNLAAWDASGVVASKEWLASPDACDECEALDGVIVGLDEEFPEGAGDGPPAHPNCRCDVVPVLTEEAPTED